MRLILIRHGDPDYEHDSLTETGFREAECLGDRMAKMNISEISKSMFLPKGVQELPRNLLSEKPSGKL